MKNTLPSNLGAVMFSKLKRIVNNFIREINGIYKYSIYYGDKDSLYIEEKFWEVLDKAGLVGVTLGQAKNDLENGLIFYGLFSAPKTNYCVTINQWGFIEEHKTFKGFNDSKRLLDCSQYFKMIGG